MTPGMKFILGMLLVALVVIIVIMVTQGDNYRERSSFKTVQEANAYVRDPSVSLEVRFKRAEYLMRMGGINHGVEIQYRAAARKQLLSDLKKPLTADDRVAMNEMGSLDSFEKFFMVLLQMGLTNSNSNSNSMASLISSITQEDIQTVFYTELPAPSGEPVRYALLQGLVSIQMVSAAESESNATNSNATNSNINGKSAINAANATNVVVNNIANNANNANNYNITTKIAAANAANAAFSASINAGSNASEAATNANAAANATNATTS